VSSRLLLAVGLMIGLPTLLQAQYGNNRSQLQRQQQQQQQRGAMQPVAIQGRIQGVAKGGIVVAANNNQAWRVSVLPVTKMNVTGATTADALRPGLVVEFVAQIDDRGAIQGKIDALTVTSITKDKQIGIVSSGDAKADSGDGGFAANAKKDSGETGGKRAKRPPRTAGKTASRTQPAGSYRVVGKLLVGRGGALSVVAGRTLSFELADQAKIDVNTTDANSFVTLVNRGTEVSVTGYAVQGRPGVMQAAEVQVKLPEPQAADKADPPVRPEPKRSSKRAKKGEDEPPPEPVGDK
jgi:hypothetical protein